MQLLVLLLNDSWVECMKLRHQHLQRLRWRLEFSERHLQWWRQNLQNQNSTHLHVQGRRDVGDITDEHLDTLWYIQDLGTCCIMLSWFCVAMCLTFLEFSRAASLKHGTECSAGLSWRLTHTSQTAGSRLAAPAFTMCCKSSSTHVTCAMGCAPKIRKKIPRTSEDCQPGCAQYITCLKQTGPRSLLNLSKKSFPAKGCDN